jgi:hypothetical protein
MLGTDKSRGYCLEMICADFLAGATLDDQNPETLLYSMVLPVPARRTAAGFPQKVSLAAGAGCTINMTFNDFPARSSWSTQCRDNDQ